MEAPEIRALFEEMVRTVFRNVIDVRCPASSRS